MADSPASIDSLYRTANLLEELALSYAFIGGIALNTWGVPRATFDLDLAVSVPAKGFERTSAAFRGAGFVVDQAFDRGFRDRIAGMEQIHLHLPVAASLMAVDLFLATTPFLEAVLSRRVEIELGRGPVWVCTAADLILLKLLADRGKDRVDLENVIAVQGIPERDYLERWAEALGLADKLSLVLDRTR
jgi:hypothetical protein